MNVLIATDGELDPQRAAEFASRLAGGDGSVTVFTAVEVPRTLLTDLRRLYGDGEELLILDHETVEVRSTERRERSSWPGDDALLDRYISDVTGTRTGPLVEALRAAGVEPHVKSVEAEKPAQAVLQQLDGIDVVCVGSHGRGRFEGMLGSIGGKISRLAPCPVLVIR